MHTAQRVFKYPKPIRLAYLAEFLRHYDYFKDAAKRYPLQVDISPWRITICQWNKADGSTLDGWIDALWESL
jgi:hypothetical protein